MANSSPKHPYLRQYRVFVASKTDPLQPATNEDDAIFEQSPNNATISTVKKEVDEFLKRTTIPGLNQLGANRRNISQFLWILLFLTGVAMAIYQSKNLISEYRRYAVSQRSTREVQWDIAFPSVTVCSNSPIRWGTYSNDPGLGVVQRTMKRINEMGDLADSLYADDFSPKEKILLEELIGLTKLERQELALPLDMFVLLCTWGTDNCTDNLLQFNNLYYGNCFTFNPGFNYTTGLMARKESLNMVVRADFPDAFPYTRRDDGTIMIIHPPGTPPVIDRRLIYSLYPGRWLKLGVSQTTMRRLPAPYTSKCVDEHSKVIRQKMLHFSETTPYLYTMEACIESCHQNLSLQLCNCVMSSLPLPENSPKEICPFHGCHTINKADGDDFLCDCHQSCSELLYNFVLEVDDRWLEQKIWLDWVKNLLTQENSKSLNLKRVSGFELYVASTKVETIQEEPKIAWPDFLGSIGGNLSLWVGISIISVVEVMELLGILVFVFLKSIFRH